jgi:hypothetical protein
MQRAVREALKRLAALVRHPVVLHYLHHDSHLSHHEVQRGTRRCAIAPLAVLQHNTTGGAAFQGRTSCSVMRLSGVFTSIRRIRLLHRIAVNARVHNEQDK